MSHRTQESTPLPIISLYKGHNSAAAQWTRHPGRGCGGGGVHALGGPGGHHLPAPPCPATGKLQSPSSGGFMEAPSLGRLIKSLAIGDQLNLQPLSPHRR